MSMIADQAARIQLTAALLIGLVAGAATAQDDDSPQQRGGRQARGALGVYRDRVEPHWFNGDDHFWYRNDLKGRTKEFILVDCNRGTRGPAFDHAKLAESLSKAAGDKFEADRLPFDEIEITDTVKSLRFAAKGKRWYCKLSDSQCFEEGPDRSAAAKAAGAVAEGARNLQQRRPFRGFFQRNDADAQSPDKKWTASIKDGNVHLRAADDKDSAALTKDGSTAIPFGMLRWSPDSKALVAFRIEPGEHKEVHLIESSPKAGGRAILTSRPYPLPGDRFDVYEPWLIDPAKKSARKLDVDKIDFGRPEIRWRKDGKRFTYEKVDRGHQRFRLVEINVETGAARNLIDEQSKTFIWTVHTENVGVPLVTWLDKTDEIIYSSERTGWRRLHLIDAESGTEKNVITPEGTVLRGVDIIDEASRRIYFRACGGVKDQDPYFIHNYRVDFDGANLVRLTDGDGTHTVQFSPSSKHYFIDTYSQVNVPPIVTLRSAQFGKQICALEQADVYELQGRGWTPPEPFVAKGRDGATDIWGVVQKPKNFDPKKKYPVIENIYAGPQGSFVPKAFSPFNRWALLTDLGFVVVQIDGMGTANRSKAFHDVCWHDLKDAGFPDRILWHKAFAAKNPWYDISRVGIYGTSAGGQNAMGAVLFHGDFYKAACASCGCHDNRMDKASWNEQWMGYPVGPHYAASSNVDNAKRLTGKLLLIVGEMDNNVPPESTLRVVDALIKADKDFEFLMVPGMNHSDGGPYGRRRMQDFFRRTLLDPPRRS